MTGPVAEPVRVIVVAACGCRWRESRPPGFRIDPDAPRVCTMHRPDHPAAVGTSPQGMAMVPVQYLPDDGSAA